MEDKKNASVRAFEDWVVWFKEHVVVPDLDRECIASFLRYLKKLKFFEELDLGGWQISGGETSAINGLPELLQRLRDLGQTKSGFAITYFIPLPAGQSPVPLPLVIGNSFGESHELPAPEKTSDVSNLQIVKKMGRQLRPFLDVEKETMKVLEGVGLEKGDARGLFNFIMSQSQEKSAARPWEQHSRKRHK